MSVGFRLHSLETIEKFLDAKLILFVVIFHKDALVGVFNALLDAMIAYRISASPSGLSSN